MRARLVSLLLRRKTPPVWLGLAVAVSLIAVESGVVLLLMDVAPGSAFGVVYLLGVLAVSTVWGFALSAATSVASALTFDYLRNWPGHLGFGPENWAVIGVFVIVALMANTLACLVRERAVEAERSRDQLRVLARLQFSLRRVATQVARGATPTEVFSTVAAELACCLGVHHATLVRFELDGGSVLLATHDDRVPKMPVGTRFEPEGENIAAMVFRTGRPARMNSHDDATGSAAAIVRAVGLRSGVGAPIVVDGRVWGAAIVGSSQDDPLPEDAEARLGDFADLVATAIANAETRAQLTASRARIVSAGDEARRRFERDLHDGAQQRLVSLGLKLRAAEAAVPVDLDPLRRQIADVVDGLVGVSKDLQDISRGIHPAILSRGGLAPALKTLARRSAIPVDLHLGVDRRLPDTRRRVGWCRLTQGIWTGRPSGPRRGARRATTDLQPDRERDIADGDDPTGRGMSRETALSHQFTRDGTESGRHVGRQAAPLRVVVAEDDVLLREGLVSLLDHFGFDVVGQAGDGPHLLALVRETTPELVVTDNRMPPTNCTEGFDAARMIRAELPDTAILVLSAYVDVDQAMELLDGGRSIGYLLKSRITDVADFVDTLQRITKGGLGGGSGAGGRAVGGHPTA